LDSFGTVQTTLEFVVFHEGQEARVENGNDTKILTALHVSRQRVVGRGRGSLASGCGEYEKREGWPRTRAEKG